ncbi:MAG TPA: PQQ-dependent catabolism-associated CXXCW motif protein [Pseudolabrys sp.]|nr:PQQ-dependent catabolism-associated CXXCW motif protein [Pseudolabrys sp.]
MGLQLGALAQPERHPPEPDTYRLDHYRAPTPQTLQGATVIDTHEAEEIWKKAAAVFIDVLPRPPKPRNLPPGTIWHEQPRLDIPGSIWLPDTGYGALAQRTEQYFRAGLRKATNGNLHQALVIYCLRDCWMSWNAAKRALALGYTHVIWYPEGTDGWAEAGLPLRQAIPLPPP